MREMEVHGGRSMQRVVVFCIKLLLDLGFGSTGEDKEGWCRKGLGLRAAYNVNAHKQVGLWECFSSERWGSEMAS